MTDSNLRKKPWSPRNLLLIGVLIGTAFLAGFLWQYVEARGAREERDALAESLTFEEMATTLATATIQADAGSFENARSLASRFFDRLNANVADAPADQREALDAILRQRDAVITALARSEPIGEDLLARLFVRYRVATGGLEEGVPLPVGSPGPETVPPEPGEAGAGDGASAGAAADTSGGG